MPDAPATPAPAETSAAPPPATTEATPTPTPQSTPAEAAPAAPPPKQVDSPALAKAIQAQRAAEKRQAALEARAKELEAREAALTAKQSDLEKFNRVRELSAKDKAAAVRELFGEGSEESVLQELTDWALKNPGTAPVKLPPDVQARLERAEALEKQFPELKSQVDALREQAEQAKQAAEKARLDWQQKQADAFLESSWRAATDKPEFALLKDAPDGRELFEAMAVEMAEKGKALPDAAQVAAAAQAKLEEKYKGLLTSSWLRERLAPESKAATAGPSAPPRTVTSERGDTPTIVDFDKLPLKTRLRLAKEGKAPR